MILEVLKNQSKSAIFGENDSFLGSKVVFYPAFSIKNGLILQLCSKNPTIRMRLVSRFWPKMVFLGPKSGQNWDTGFDQKAIPSSAPWRVARKVVKNRVSFAYKTD